MLLFRNFLILSSLVVLASCSKQDTESPVISLVGAPTTSHFRGEPYLDEGIVVIDNHTCNLENEIFTDNTVDENRYGAYTVTYSVQDEAGNATNAVRNVEVVLPLTDYYLVDWHAFDTCTSGNYAYIGLVQDCDCPDFNVTVGNISNLGLSAIFALPVSGQFNQFITLDTAKAGVTFSGIATMNPTADSLFWSYIIADSVSSDVCTSVWVK